MDDFIIRLAAKLPKRIDLKEDNLKREAAPKPK